MMLTVIFILNVLLFIAAGSWLTAEIIIMRSIDKTLLQLKNSEAHG